MDSLYKSFLAVVESETLIRAAERLHMSQPTLSRQIQQLEAEIGSPLFNRIGKRLVLNRAGELAYQTAKHCVLLEDKLRSELESLADPEVGTIHIGAGLTPSIHLLPPILAQYRELHPRIRFHVKTGSSREILTALRQRDVDLAVVTTVDSASDDIATSPLMEDPLLIVASPPMASEFGGCSVRFKTLSDWPFVVLREGSGLRDLVLSLAKQNGVDLAIAAETDSLESISRLVQHGFGFSILPSSAVREDILRGQLVPLTSDVILPSRTLQLVAPRHRLLPAATTQFMRWIPR